MKQNESLMARFKNTFLLEMPLNIGKYTNNTKFLEELINDINWYKEEKTPEKINENTFKIDTPTKMYYYAVDHDKIVLAVTLEKAPLGLIVRMIGKDPNYKNRAPYATDLFKVILKDGNTVIMSDYDLTLDGKKNYEKLFDAGLRISVYDRRHPGKTFKPFKSKNEMEEYFGTSDEHKFYHFVVSESKTQADINSHFTLRRYREFNNNQDEDS
jgi:hypothetical protein